MVQNLPIAAASRRRLMRNVAVSALLAAATLFVGAGTAAAQGAPIKVGEFFDLTGGAATVAEASKFGADIAIAEINKNGGIAGRKIETTVADTQTDPTVGVGEIKRLVLQEKVDVVIGPVISQVLIASLPVLNDAKILSLGATGADEITPQAAPYNFSILINAQAQAQAMALQAAEGLGSKSVAMLSDTGAQAKSFVEEMKRQLAAKHVTLTGTQEFQYHATDMTPQLLALKRGNPDSLIFFATSGEDVGNTLKSLGDLGWDVKVTGNYSVGGFAPGAIKIAGAEAFKNVTGINYNAFAYCAGGDNPKASTDFVTKARAFDAARAGRLPIPVATFFYDQLYLLKAAVEASGGKTDGPTLAAWIEGNAKSFDGVNPHLNASKETHFLIGFNNIAIVHPEKLRDGIFQERVRCP